MLLAQVFSVLVHLLQFGLVVEDAGLDLLLSDRALLVAHVEVERTRVVGPVTVRGAVQMSARIAAFNWTVLFGWNGKKSFF